MRPEEEKHANDQREHEFRRDPHVGVAIEIVGRGMWLKGDKTGGRTLMALPAGLQAIVGMHAGRGIADTLDLVTSVTVKTLGRIGVAQRIDLAVIGLRVGLQAFFMTISAVPGDDQPRQVHRRAFHVMGRVAIGADRRIGVGLLQDFLAVHRSRVRGQLPRVALAADVGDAQAPLGADRTALRIDVMGVMAVVAACIGA